MYWDSMFDNLSLGHFMHQQDNNWKPQPLTASWVLDTYYAYGTAYESRRFLGENNPFKGSSYYYQINGDWYKHDRHGRQTKVANFVVHHVRVVMPMENGTFMALEIEFSTEGMRVVTVIPYDGYTGRRLLRHFKEIRKSPNCGEAALQEIIFYQIQNCPNVDYLVLPQKPGFHIADDGQVMFATAGCIDPYLKEYYPIGVQERSINWSGRTLQDVTIELRSCLPQSWKCFVPVLVSVFSVLLTMFADVGLETKQVLVYETGGKFSEELLVALTKNISFSSLVTQSLGAKKRDLEATLSKANDSTVLFLDITDINDKKSIQSGIDCIIRDLHHAGGTEEYSKHQPVIITRTAGDTFSGDDYLTLSLDDVKGTSDVRKIQRLMEELISIVIQIVLGNPNFRDVMQNLNRKLDSFIPANMNANRRGLYRMILITWGLFLRPGLFTQETLNPIIGWLAEPQEYVNGSAKIVDDFAAVLNQGIREGIFKIQRKNDRFSYEAGTNTLLVFEDTLCLEPEMAEQTVIQKMVTTHNIDALMRALKECELLCATNKNRRSLTVYSAQGRSKSIPFYCVSQALLDIDNQDKVNHLSDQEFLITNDDENKENFLPLLSVKDGLAAGRKLIYQDAENNHIYITGQSGYGKTFALSQLAAFHAGLGYKVIVLDASDSFSKEALSRNLPKGFVNRAICFHSLENDGIPVDLLYHNLPNKKKILLSIISAAVREITHTQVTALENVLSDVLRMVNEGERIRTENVLAKFDPESQTGTSLIARLRPVFEDLDACGMSSGTWNNFFVGAKPITVLSTETANTQNGTQILDMLIASLWQYQKKNPERPLVIIIDELQNQNFKGWAPIPMILHEGRRFHISFIGATQSFFAKGSDLGDAMSMADTKMFLKPPRDSETAVLTELRYHKSEISRFDRMERGSCIVKGNLFSREKGRNCSATIIGNVSKYQPIE